MDESKGWIAVAIFIIGFAFGIFVAALFVGLDSANYFKVTIMQTRQEILSLPNGTTWKKIRTAEEEVK